MKNIDKLRELIKSADKAVAELKAFLIELRLAQDSTHDSNLIIVSRSAITQYENLDKEYRDDQEDN